MARPFIVLELVGHIIDSLTLAKVIDKVQAFGLDYQINDVRIGLRKHDMSSAYLSLWADRQEDLDRAVTELESYGAHPVPPSPARTVACEQDGVLPGQGYVRPNPPIEVLWQGEWLPVEREGCGYTVVLKDGRAFLRQVGDLRRGDAVVAAGAGLRVLPEA